MVKAVKAFIKSQSGPVKEARDLSEEPDILYTEPSELEDDGK